MLRFWKFTASCTIRFLKRLINKISRFTIEFIGMGSTHMGVVDTNGILYIWGSNEHGKLGRLIEK